MRGIPRLPPGAIDTHFHVFGPEAKYPYFAERSYTPDDASIESYLQMAAGLGVERAVIVQPSVYGSDNRLLLDTLSATALPLRGIVAVDEDVRDTELDAMHEVGVRGIRINLVYQSGTGLRTARRLAEKIRSRGWHLQFLIDASTLPDLFAVVEELGVAVVFDHIGHVPASKGIQDPGFQALLALLRNGIAWVKISGAYRMTDRSGYPPYPDVTPFAAAAIAANPEQVVWASDWPHTALHVPMPDDRDLLDMTLDWLPDDKTGRQLFVTNAERLYDFAPYRPGAGRISA